LKQGAIMPENVRLIAREFADVMPAAQLSTDVDAVVAGSEIDTALKTSLSYTIRVITNAVTWTVFGADAASYADEVIVQAPASVAAAGVGSYSTALAVYRYYRVKIKATSAGNQGTATVLGHCKA
jgi:hypothetical protein